jgi:hypothetical protein
MAINVLFMASPLFMNAEDSEYSLPNPKFHILLEHSMNRVAEPQPGLPAASLYCDAPSARPGICDPLHKVVKGPESTQAKTIGMLDPSIEQIARGDAINCKNGVDDRKKPHRSAAFQPCSMGTSLDSFQFGGPLTLQIGIA